VSVIVEILRDNKKTKGKIGDEVDIDPVLGNYLAGFGYVRIVKHDKPGKAAKAKNTLKKPKEIDPDESDKE